MKIKKIKIDEDQRRGVRWAIIEFSSDDNSKKSRVFASASYEFMTQSPAMAGDHGTKEDRWMELIKTKWSNLGEEILNQSIHFDIYSMKSEGESEALNFLIKKKNATAI